MKRKKYELCKLIFVIETKDKTDKVNQIFRI